MNDGEIVTLECVGRKKRAAARVGLATERERHRARCIAIEPMEQSGIAAPATEVRGVVFRTRQHGVSSWRVSAAVAIVNRPAGLSITRMSSSS